MSIANGPLAENAPQPLPSVEPVAASEERGKIVAAKPKPTDELIPVGELETDLPSAFPGATVTPIDMPTALGLVEVRNPNFLLAQQRVLETMALRQLAAAQYLPTLNLGVNYDDHTGPLQQSSGNILPVQRSALFVGAGANAIAAGTVNIPGVLWQQNAGDALFGLLQANQAIARARANTAATRNTMGLNVALAYLDLLEAEGRRSIALQIRQEAAELTRITEAHARTGQGRYADANRATTELADFDARAIEAEGDTFRMSARLSQLLGLDQSTRLHPTDNWVVPHPLVPELIPLEELLAIAIVQRPELAEYRAAVEQAMLALRGAQLLPFSPNVFLGFSSGAFGGGSNLVAQPPGSSQFASGQPRFGDFAGRADFDAMMYWTLKNLGVGNSAQIEGARARLSTVAWQRLVVFETVRLEVSNAHAYARMRLAQLDASELAIRAATQSWTEDLNRIRSLEGLPIEAVNSLRLMARARLAYLDSIIGYNRSQFQLYVALGQPPADALARPAPIEQVGAEQASSEPRAPESAP
ncbi:MAG TPA: TolC family protein [Pirellulales bacterium]|nr:TolC family protein [Pirellulales bacterium]